MKWFGGFNNQTGQINDYGFVECQGKGDIWVHRTEIYCSESDLKEGTLVKFELRIYGNGYRASNLHLLNLSE
ncbi:cold shock domain-containing protein [Nostoc commune]|uniref:cold shock domain-containing protein n=1 Tax=Nostoc commune TaxID=1178 RepID=UPI000D5A20C3